MKTGGKITGERILDATGPKIELKSHSRLLENTSEQIVQIR